MNRLREGGNILRPVVTSALILSTLGIAACGNDDTEPEATGACTSFWTNFNVEGDPDATPNRASWSGVLVDVLEVEPGLQLQAGYTSGQTSEVSDTFSVAVDRLILFTLGPGELHGHLRAIAQQGDPVCNRPLNIGEPIEIERTDPRFQDAFEPIGWRDAAGELPPNE